MLKKTTIIALLAGVVLLAGGTAWGKVSQSDAERLKKDLTPFGAERAGNAAGTIPAWDGGIQSIPEGLGYRESGDFHPDPFKDDKVLFSITAQNIDKYAKNLTKGVASLLKKHPDMRLDVYPTHRTAAAPQEVYDNTFKNATLCELTEDKQGITSNGGWGGYPFPIPQNGNEAVFNHNLRWRGAGMEGDFKGLNVQKNGKSTQSGGGVINERYPWYSSDQSSGDVYQQFVSLYSIPPRRSGEIVLAIDALNMSQTPRKAWQYLPGQRRVRRAPSIAYDNPNPSTSGLATYDDTFVFNGGLDRFDWKIVEKKELYIPYNQYAFDLASTEEILTPKFPNPDFMRWELHRVWVIEGTLRDGKRHSYSKRVLYLDEDTWNAVSQDAYDSNGNIWRVSLANTKNVYELPAVVLRAVAYFDLTRDDYSFTLLVNGFKEHFKYTSTVGKDYFTPENMRRLGRR